MMLASIVPRLFRYSENDRPEKLPTLKSVLASVTRLGSISLLDQCLSKQCRRNAREKKKNKAFLRGAKILQKSFDIEKFIRHGFALRTILRLFLTS